MTYKYRHSFRETKEYSKAYLDGLCEKFTPLFIDALPSDNLRSIDFGKQDARGGPSITVLDDRGCVPYQKYFGSYKEMTSYMQGFVAAHTNGGPF